MTIAHSAFTFLVAIGFFGWFSSAHDSNENRQYRIVYNVNDKSGGGSYEVFSMTMDGTDQKNITRHKDVAWVYSANRDRLYFISDRDTCYRCYFLYEMNAYGNNLRKIGNLQLEDSWVGTRNNGEELVVSGRVGKEIRYQLFIIDAKSGMHRQITNDTAALYRDPAFSPDGKRIVFAYKKQKRDRSQHEELFLMNDDGSNLKQLTTYPADDTTAPMGSYHAGPPRWNATHNFISYFSFQKGKYSLFAVTPDGSKQWKLTNNPQNEGWHDWTPDGVWLAIDLSDSSQTQYHIGLMNWDSKELRILTDTTFRYQQGPVFVEEP